MGEMSKIGLYLAYFCIYSLILLAIGKSSLRTSATPRDYFICERMVGLFPAYAPLQERGSRLSQFSA